MAIYASSTLALRRKLIVEGLLKCGALSPETAKTLAEAGVANPDDFKGFTRMFVQSGAINQTPEGKFWVKGV